MGYSHAMVYTTAKTSPVDDFKHGWQNDMATNMAILFAKGGLWRSSFLGNLKPSDKKLGLWRTPTWDIVFIIFSIMSASNIVVLGQP